MVSETDFLEKYLQIRSRRPAFNDRLGIGAPDGYNVIQIEEAKSDEMVVDSYHRPLLKVSQQGVEEDLARTSVYLTSHIRTSGDWWLTSRVCPAGLTGWAEAHRDGVFEQSLYEQQWRERTCVLGGEPLWRWAEMHRALAGQVELLESLDVRPSALGDYGRRDLCRVPPEGRAAWLGIAKVALKGSRNLFDKVRA